LIGIDPGRVLAWRAEPDQDSSASP
jgi:hypothetical protein